MCIFYFGLPGNDCTKDEKTAEFLYSTGWILKFVIEKVSFGRKLKIEILKKIEKSVLGSKIYF